MPAGLSEAEAQTRRAHGQGNIVELGTSRTYLDIARANLFTFFNNILFTIGIALIALGQVNDALTSVGLGLINALISTLQELRAKHQLDRIALLNRPVADVIRDGVQKAVDPAELVRGDVLSIRAGDQVVVDGTVIEGGELELDESLLTGESDLVRKRVGDMLLSGSVCISGNAYYQADQVGSASFANQLTAKARSFQLISTPLQNKIESVVRLVMLIVSLISGIILLAAILESLPALRMVQLAAVLSGQVPYGLFLLVVVAYALGAAAIAKQGALVQQINAIESLSNIDVLCLDKTGTLTANRLKVHAVHPLDDLGTEELKRLLGNFARSVTEANPTTAALGAGLSGERYPVADEIAFASARKWSALAFDLDDRRGVYALGAVEMLAPYLPTAAVAGGAPLIDQLTAWSEEGLRVLVLAHNPDVVTLHDANGQPELPSLVPLGLVCLSDELRPHAKETLAAFLDFGIQLKIISGDDPNTVAALTRQAGLSSNNVPVSGPALAEMSSASFDRAAVEGDVFGRIGPAQKEQLIDALIRQGYRVAMMGDGVNDVLSLKKAQLGIAMQSGSPASRNVADIVLLDDSFAALQPAFHEGQRIFSGVTRAMYLFLTRVATSTLIIIAVTMLGLAFPFEPAQMALTIFTVGIPTLFLTLWARPQQQPVDLFRSLLRFVMPVAILTMIIGVAIYAFHYNRVIDGIDHFWAPPQVIEHFERATGLSYNDDQFGIVSATIVAQTALSIFISYTAFLLILFLEPPIAFFTGWTTKISSDKRPALLVLALASIFCVVIATPLLSGYFGMITAAPPIYVTLAVALPAWTLILRTIWRRRWFERFLMIDA